MRAPIPHAPQRAQRLSRPERAVVEERSRRRPRPTMQLRYQHDLAQPDELADRGRLAHRYHLVERAGRRGDEHARRRHAVPARVARNATSPPALTDGASEVGKVSKVPPIGVASPSSATVARVGNAETTARKIPARGPLEMLARNAHT